MKKIGWMVLALGIGVLGLAGCKKPQKPQESQVVNGVSVDMPKLLSMFANSTNDQIRKLIFDADQGFRYGDYAKALAAVDELSNNPDLTEDQKKVVRDVLEQLKKVAGGTPAAAAPAQ